MEEEGRKTMVVLQQQQRKKMRTSRDWAGLPHNILDETLDRLTLSDYISFASVCVSWRSTALDDRNHRGKQNQVRTDVRRQQLPMLMLPHWSDKQMTQFYSVTREKILKFQLRMPCYTKRFIGSSCGWLISVDTDFAVTLFNPFSSSTIPLPPVINSDIIYCFNHEYYFVKAILSADPALHPNEYVVMVIYGDMSSLAFIKPGSPAPCWFYLELFMQGFSDVIYSKLSRLFYALRETGEVYSIDIEKRKADCFTSTLESGERTTDLRYIVETSSGALLQVYRFLRDDSDPPFGRISYHTGEMKVFKLDKTTSTTPSIPPFYCWAELKSLGDNALFVGDCTSMCVSASDFPGCRPGSIYFSLPFHKSLLVQKKPFLWDCIDDYDLGVANIEGRPVQPFQIGCRKSDVFNAIPNRPPIWVLPTFQARDWNSGDWAALPHNILDEILDRLVSLQDYIRFASVCGSWRSAALDDRNHRGQKKNQKSQRHPKYMNNLEDDHHHQLPMLMLPHWSDEYRAQFYSITHRKILDFQLPVPYYSKRFIGSSFGWLISVDTNFSVTLFNPFSSSTIHLPPVITPKVMREDDENFDFETLHLYCFNHEYYFVKAILSADPASYPHDYVVMVIYGELRRLAFIRPGAGAAAHWTYLDFQMQGFSDVIYSKSTRLFYALHMTGEVYRIEDEIADCFTPTLEIGDTHEYLRYVVETRGGDLLQVVRFLELFRGRYLTNEIKVFKLDKGTPIWYWAEAKSLGDDALFVGDSASMCVAASQYPGCRPGSIYFLLPYFIDLLVKKKSLVEKEYPYDMAVANIEGRPGEPFQINYEWDAYNAIPRRPPIWVLPTFQGP